MDEAALTGMTLTAPPPTLERHEEACAAAATELSELGVGAQLTRNPCIQGRFVDSGSDVWCMSG